MPALAETKLALIISESRSGSTLLSKQINDNLMGVMVPPEIRFDLIMKKSNAWFEKSSIDKIYQLLTSKRSLDHLKISHDELTDLIKLAKADGNIGTLVMSVLTRWASGQSHENEGVKFLVVKKGVTHLKIWEKVITHCPDTVLVFLIRDPRAVVNSKFNATRIYHPFETLGWSGSALLSLRWCWHIWKTRQAAEKMPCITVRYEDLIADQTTVLNRLAAFFSVSMGESKHAYVVPEQERKIHKLVNSGEFRKDRISGWQTELSTSDQKTIELIAREPMRSLGYECMHKITWSEKIYLILRAFVHSVKNVTVHFYNHAMAVIKQQNPKQQG